jgi:hypothetical protein
MGKALFVTKGRKPLPSRSPVLQLKLCVVKDAHLG